MEYRRPKVEVVEPAEKPRPPRPYWQILKWMVALSLPALALDFSAYALFQSREPLAYVLLFFVVPPAVLLTLIAVIGNCFLTLMLFLALRGRAVVFNQNPFQNYRRAPRDAERSTWQPTDFIE